MVGERNGGVGRLVGSAIMSLAVNIFAVLEGQRLEFRHGWREQNERGYGLEVSRTLLSDILVHIPISLLRI
jgi:hypothetical protein